MSSDLAAVDIKVEVKKEYFDRSYSQCDDTVEMTISSLQPIVQVK